MRSHGTTGFPSAAWKAEALTALLATDCEHLVDLSLEAAWKTGYADRTSSLRAAWTEASERLHEAMVATICDPHWELGLNGRHNYGTDPRFASLRKAAQRHLRVGVPLELHNGLMKIYRRVYRHYFEDLFTPNHPPRPDGLTIPAEPDAFLIALEDFFDKAELAMLSPWSGDDAREQTLADSLRRMTRQRDQYFAALESLRNPVFICDESGHLVSANQAALQTFLDLSEAGALTYRLALQPHREDLQKVIDTIRNTDGTQWDSIWLETCHGRRCFDIRLRMVEDTMDKLDRWSIILMHDVTDHNQAVRQARQAERAMSLFLATMSHEIRTPLHSVLGAAELLKDAPADDRSRLIGLLDSSARLLTATLENVLSFSRFEQATPRPRPETINLRRAISELIRVTDIQARQQGIPLGCDIAAVVPDQVMLDWSMTQQILRNLLQNALRYDSGQGVSLTLSFSDARLTFQINDHGPGLPDDISSIFTQHPATLQPRPTSHNGTGLGLSIAQRMTLALGGTILSRPILDGTLIEVQIPCTPAGPSLSSAPSGSGLPQALPAGSDSVDMDPQPPLALSCLLVDDDPINALVTLAMLERLGLSVDHAQSLAQAHALDRAVPSGYDIYVIDDRLPDGRGPDFARTLRQSVTHHKTPIFLLSANTAWVRQSAEDSTLFSALLDKPLDSTALGRAIRNSLHSMGPAPVAPMLSGLSVQAQKRMIEVFTQSWQNFYPRLEQTSPEQPDERLAAQAHKLASGAGTFGLTDWMTTLRHIERVFGDAQASAADRTMALSGGLLLTLPADWTRDQNKGTL